MHHFSQLLYEKIVVHENLGGINGKRMQFDLQFKLCLFSINRECYAFKLKMVQSDKIQDLYRHFVPSHVRGTNWKLIPNLGSAHFIQSLLVDSLALEEPVSTFRSLLNAHHLLR